jgi:hypothetical protein
MNVRPVFQFADILSAWGRWQISLTYICGAAVLMGNFTDI